MRLAGVVLDWAGTIADHGSRAPVEAIRSVFANAGVPIEVAEARASMGLPKRAHIGAVLQLPRVRTAWQERYGAFPTVADRDALFAQFIPRQIEILERYSCLIAGVAEGVEEMRSQGLAIGISTGYTRPMLDYLIQRAACQGFRPDAAYCPDDVPLGRPAPWMCYRNAIELNVYPMWAMVKIGDTPVDIEEGLNAGMWTIGVTRTGNEVGLTEAEWNATSGPERTALVSIAEQRLISAGAHYTTRTVAECGPILDVIRHRLDRGEGPGYSYAGITNIGA